MASDVVPLVDLSTARQERALARRHPLAGALLVAVIAAAFAGVVVLRRAPAYSSATPLFIDAPRAVNASVDDGVLRRLILLRLNYADLARTAVIAGPVANQLGLEQQTLRDSISTIVVPNSFALVVIGRAKNRATAQRLSAAVAEQLSAYANREQAQAGTAPNHEF